MSVSTGTQGPFPFRQADLEWPRLGVGARHTVADFRRWRDAHPGAVADHVAQCTAQVAAIRDRAGPAWAVSAWPRGTRGRARRRAQLTREAVHFGVLNMAEAPGSATIEALLAGGPRGLPTPRAVLSAMAAGRGAAGVVDALRRQLPVLDGLPETGWLTERLDHLHGGLPEAVLRAGGMGKALRAMAAVLVIAAIDTLEADPAEAGEHFARVVPAAYAFGAAYAIVDDTLLDLPGGHLPAAERERYAELVSRTLATGAPVAAAELPDHPLAEELALAHAAVRDRYPFESYRHLYHAAESMHRAQRRDAAGGAGPQPTAPGAGHPDPAGYEDLLVKAGMSRVVANIFARRRLPEPFYRRCVNTVLISQLRDDLIDRDEDARCGRPTPFTRAADGSGADPLYDLFAYTAYVAAEVYGGDAAVADALTGYGAARLAAHLSADPRRAAALARDYPPTGEVARFLRVASGVPPRAVRRVEAVDQRLRRRVGELLDHRNRRVVDCRTFVADRLPYLNEVVVRHCPPARTGELGEIIGYALAGQGKRLRPALTLMLAEGLGVDPVSIEPVLAAGELFHTASLLFDDLPAQDDATVRRGRPAAHLVFDEGSVQLAALSMISTGFGLLAGLDRWFPAHRVTEVIGYAGAVLGSDRLCRGQHLDLRMDRRGAPATGADILQMYALKTSTAIEAALVPLMMVLDRPAEEVALLARYAHHAGIVFQLCDDILDATSSTEVLGKDAGNDLGRVNIVRERGLGEADRLLAAHLAQAVDCCARLPFDTRLLECAVRHFADRRR